MIALATCAELPEGWQEDELRDALDATWAVWDDPGVDWRAFDLVVVRSTWDYTPRRDLFLAWAQGLPRLVNPAGVLAWNTEKRYLRDLADAGLAVVPTTFVAPGGTFAPPAAGDYVVKPTVSAGSRDTGRFTAGTHDDLARALAARLHAAGRTAMVQPYLASVDTRGETALLYAGGAFSHAVQKTRILDAGDVAALDTAADPPLFPRDPTAAERATGDRVMGWLADRFGAGALAYARVDLIEGDDGAPVVLERELTEPSLFLTYAAGAAERFAAAFARCA